jgi:hypothetical protein
MDGFKKFFLESELTLKYHDALNPLIWDHESLKKEVRDQLLKIAKVWQEYANIPEAAVRDVLLTGGNANFNYTKYSDLDLHILVDKKKIADCESEVLDDYLKDKKALWALNHDIKIYGLPVELYAQGIDEPTSSDQGVFSLRQNKWLKKPVKKEVNLKDSYLQRKIKNLKQMIDYFVDSKCDDVKEMEQFKEKLRNMRSASIRSGGEFSVENLAFKELRNIGYLDKFTNYLQKMQDYKLSLK